MDTENNRQNETGGANPGQGFVGADNQNSSRISEPDESGVRYFRPNRAGYGAGYGANYGTNYGCAGGYAAPPKPRKICGIPRGLFIFIVVVLVVTLLAVVIGMAVPNINADVTMGAKNLPNSDYIATLYVEGTIQDGNTDYFGNPIGYQHQWTLDTVDELMYDSNNKGIILFVNSPGGGVYESDELYLKLEEYKEISGNPVYSYMGNMAASGGYYISAAADKIIANRNCWTGSIGVTIGSLLDLSGLMEKYGVKANFVDSGKFKAMGSSYRPMSDEEKAIWQSLIDDAYMQFIAIVADSRGYDLETVKKIADGRIYTAAQAVEIDLIDGMGSFDDAIDDMCENYDLYGCDVVDLIPESKNNFLSMLSGAVGRFQDENKSDLAILTELAEGKTSMPISYTCEVLMK